MASIPTGIDPKAIGERIVMLRKALDMSAADFARHVGIGTNTLSNYETGYRRPELDKALEIVRKTGATLDFIYLGDASSLPMRIAGKLHPEEQQRKAG